MSTLRQRKGQLLDHDTPSSPRAPLLRRVAAVDMFPKPKEEYKRSQSVIGGYVSLGTVAVLSLLLIVEGFNYLSGRNAYRTEVSIDSGISGRMKVNMDIVFPLVPCHQLSVDIVDAAGTKRFNVTRSLEKSPVTRSGERVFDGIARDNTISGDFFFDQTEQQYCGSCTLETPSIETDDKEKDRICCNTCHSVIEYFEQRNLVPPPKSKIPQCLHELSLSHPGCSVRGTLNLKKVTGTIIFGPRRFSATHYQVSDVFRFDASHIIKSFSFGDERIQRFSSRGPVMPLDGHFLKAQGMTEVKYFLKVVPTTYRSGKGGTAESSFEYSAHWSHRAVSPGFYGALPSVTVGFDISPMQVNNVFERESFLHFVVKLCGIIGGLFVVLGAIDSSASWAVQTLRLA